MMASAPAPVTPPAPGRGAPILIVASLPGDVFAWADALRRTHYLPGRNRLGAHVTLFHGLPPSGEGEVRRLLAAITAREAPPEARITGLMDLGQGTALSVESPAMLALHVEIAEHLRGLVQQQDSHPPQLHITVQNKVPRDAARALQQELAATLPSTRFRFTGLATHRWDGSLWQFERQFAFRGSSRR